MRWTDCIAKFFEFKECKYRLCKYHYERHYADVVKVIYKKMDNGKVKKVSQYYYHGHKIAEYDGRLLEISAQGYITPSTRDRLHTLTPRNFSVHLACKFEKHPHKHYTPIAMYIKDEKEKKMYLLDYDSFYFKLNNKIDLKNYCRKIVINAENKEIVNKSELLELVYITDKINSKNTIVLDWYGRKYLKIDGKYLIRFDDLKMFEFITPTYAIESDLSKIFGNIKSKKELLAFIKERNKRLYREILMRW